MKFTTKEEAYMKGKPFTREEENALLNETLKSSSSSINTFPRFNALRQSRENAQKK